MRLTYTLPHPALRSLLSVHVAVDSAGAARVHTLPAMLPNLHIRLSGQSSYLFADGRAAAAPAVTLLGPTTAAYRIVASGDLRFAAVGFLPTGWLALVGAPAASCTDQLIGAADLWGEAAVDRLLGRLHALPFDGGLSAVIESFLCELRRAPSERLARHARTIDGWIEASQSLSVDDLARRLDVSRRQLQRATLDVYGMGPKGLAMKYRALRAAATVVIGDGAVPDAPSMPYADQSHMIRDFHRFVGWTPSTLRRDQRLAAATTIQGRWKVGAGRPLVILS